MASASTPSGGKAGEICETCEIVLRIGIFYDGTYNNSYNIQAAQKNPALKEERGGSYANDHSNVWKLHKLYPANGQISDVNDETYLYGNIYVEGIGTKAGDKDSTRSGATGGTGWGVIPRSTQGATRTWEFVRAYSSSNIVRIEVDVFGFSRGAAAGRHYVHLFDQLKGVYTPYEIEPKPVSERQSFIGYPSEFQPRAGMEGEKRAKKSAYDEEYSVFSGIPTKIKFVGLFDSVASMMTVGGEIGLSKNDHGDVKMHLPQSSADRVVQLAATSERRKRFSLTSVLSSPPAGHCTAPSVTNEGKFTEECVHGVHSDVGGGYVPEVDEDIIYSDSALTPNDGGAVQDLLDKGLIGSPVTSTEETSWLGTTTKTHTGPGGTIAEKIRRKPPTLFSPGSGSHETRLKREGIKGVLSRLALHRMHDYATGESVPLDTVDAGPSTADGPGDPLHHHTSIPEELETIHQKIHKGEPLTPEESGFLKQNFVHESGSEKEIHEAMSPIKNRIIYPN